jgi:Fur family ferric uptake transcriptional regulator
MMGGWEQCLADAGCRITAPRRAVMQVLQKASVPLSPREILEQGKRVYRRLGLVTVYRTVNLLAELNLVRRVHREDGCHGYLLASPGHRHALICQCCGRAVEFPGEDDLHALIERVEAGTGYRVDDHLLQLLGLCPDCQGTEV